MVVEAIRLPAALAEEVALAAFYDLALRNGSMNPRYGITGRDCWVAATFPWGVVVQPAVTLRDAAVLAADMLLLCCGCAYCGAPRARACGAPVGIRGPRVRTCRWKVNGARWEPGCAQWRRMRRRGDGHGN